MNDPAIVGPAGPAPSARSASAVLVAEALGTFVLVIAIVGTTLFSAGIGDDTVPESLDIRLLSVALAAGLSVLVGMYAFGDLSGGHFNPAVTIGLAAAGRFPWKTSIGYILAQILGGTVATTVVVLIGLFGPADWLERAQDGGFASNGWGSLSPAGFDVGGAIVVEVVFAAVLVMVVLRVTRAEPGTAPFAGLAVGLAFTLIHLVTIPIDGTGINPARSIATAIYGGPQALAQVWVFIVFPIVGALVAGLAHRALFEAKPHT